MRRLLALYQSFYSRKLYRDVATEWKGIGVLYLLLLLALTWIPSAVRWYGGLRDFSATSGRRVVTQLPIIEIRNGIMRATPGGRHQLRDESTGETFLIVDDTIDAVPNDIATQTMVLTRREFGVINPQRDERRIFPFSDTTTFDLSAAKAQRFLDAIPMFFAPLAYMACVAGSLVFRTLQVVVYGQIALFVARRMKVNLDTKAAIRLAAVAITPVVIFRTALWFAPSEPSWYIRWPIALAITLAMLYFAVRANQTVSAQPAPAAV